MSKVMRVVPALFVGRRSLVVAEKVEDSGGQAEGYRCGACHSVILPENCPNIHDVVVKCQCGEYNQI